MVKQKVPIEVVFSSNEAIKQIPFKLSSLSFSLTSSMPGIDRGYFATIFINPEHTDSVIEKIRLEEGVASVRSAAQ